MIEKSFTIELEHGFHARPASKLTNTCQQFKCNLQIKKGNSVTDPKSILGIIGMCARKGEVVTFTADGTDEAEAIRAIEALFEKDFKA
jgi:phosphocarrier protein